MQNLGARIYGLAAIIMGIATLVWADFAVEWLPFKGTLPGRAAIAYAVGALLVAGGALINVRRTAMWGAALLTAVLALGIAVFDLPSVARHMGRFVYWDSTAEQLALVAGGLIAFVSFAELEPQRSARLEYICRLVFGLCLLSFGAAHFVYPEYTWPLVPKWLPPNQLFWANFTGAAQIAAGVSILSGVLALWAARLLTLMYIIFGVLVHAPLLLAAPADHEHLKENALNLALVGAAWIVAESLSRSETRAPR